MNKKALKVKIKSWTSSFKYPTFVSGFQPTLPCPPISTIYGLLSAAKGSKVTPKNVKIGYRFSSEDKTQQLFRLRELKRGDFKSNVVEREVLINNNLTLWVLDGEFKEYFEKPMYPLLLGRTEDICKVEKIKDVNLEKVTSTKVGICPLPFQEVNVPGFLHSLPTHFTDDIPREPCGVKMYIIPKENQEISSPHLYEDEDGEGFYVYGEED